MVSSKVSNRYALSLLSIALEKNMLDTVYNDVKLLISAFNDSDELQRVVESPVVRPELKISILDEIFSGKIDNETTNFIHFIIEKRREEILYSVAEKFI
ncbi:MAG: ATP synthase F1 subunit delta [Ignavibacteriae bacterium]|nr:MAG: ATP synthase F1 subunit delta [Ignavibacteriota bacterium]